MPNSQPAILSIAGYDPSSGAGITADTKTAAAHGCYALTCITALTVQSTRGVRWVEPVLPQNARETLEALAEDFPIAAVRLGMLGSAGVAAVVADFLEAHRPAVVVVDPVLRSSSGAALIDGDGAEILRTRIVPLATVVTPNTAEAAALTKIQVSDAASQRAAAEALLHLGAKAAVVTGGHLEVARDLLAWKAVDAVQFEEFSAPILPSRNTHGTGCAFACSIACSLARGVELREAVRLAKEFVRRGIEQAPGLGHGNGPMKLI